MLHSASSVIVVRATQFLVLLLALVTAVPVSGQVFTMADGAQWETCSGVFHDSGGAGGAYGNNEVMVATLCPTGGAGAGPFSSITFTAWSVAPGTDDVLNIYDGANTSGALLATGSGASSLLGQSFVSTDASGCLTFQWTSNATVVAAGWTAEITTGPNAGGNGSTTVCSDAAQFDLFSLLAGSPDVGGEWRLAGNLVTNIYTPGTSVPGTYTYTVPAVSPCVDASANVVVTQITAPEAGFDAATSVCSNEPAFSMRSRLLGSPQAGGTWTLNGVAHGDQFVPSTDISGVYVYVVAGTAPCVNDTARLTVTRVQAPNAGSNGSINVCSTALPFDLLGVLGGTPDAGGTWTGPTNQPHGAQFIPGTDAPGAYTYRVAGQSPCAQASATVTVTVQTAISPGTSTNTVVCSNGASVNLRTLLGTTASGTWTGPSTITSNQYDPPTDLPGTYTFTVAATGVCPASSATVDVAEVLAPNAGTNGSRTVCSIGSNVDLFSRLGGTPEAGGSWSDPASQPFPSGVFVPGTNTPGVYTYTVAGVAPCANATATVTITQVQAADAGLNGSVTLCSNAAPETLFVHLGGTPQAGGTWYKPVPPGGTIGGVYNPANVNHPAGVYTYVVPGNAPCPADSATVTVVENQAPNAGTNGTLTLCSTSAPAQLIASLGGSPNGGGTWLGPTNAPFPGGLFDPATNATGTYKYVVTGLAPCTNDTGFVQVSVNIAPDAGISDDTTVCSNGPVFSLITVLDGSPDAGGTWAPGSGNYDPGSGQPSVFTYTVAGLAPCINASASVTVVENALPNAGSNGSVTLCSTEPPLNLFSRLGGTPNTGGTWSPGDPSGVYNPASSDPGTFTYTLTGTAPCPNVSANVVVTENPAPNAGTNGTITVCSGTSSVPLFPGLGGGPDAGGTWTALDNINPGSLSAGTFFCTGVAPGNYDFRYSLPGNGQCPPDQAEVRVTITAALDAGSDGTVQACRSNTAFNLFSGLGGAPQQGGTWKQLPSGQVVVNPFNMSTLASGTYQFRYVLLGSGGCPSDSSVATITVVNAPFAGSDVSVPLCGNAGIVPLFPFLTDATAEGTWRRTSPPGSFSGVYNTNVNNPGVYLHILQASGPCPSDTARVTVTETPAPNAGCSSSFTVCSNGAQFNMTQQLGCAPALNGTWTTPGGASHSATFVPGIDVPGIWTYTVAGAAPCPNATATLAIVVNSAPAAGLDGATTVCTTSSVFALPSVLNGTPDGGGWWTDTSGTQVVGGLFDPLVYGPGEHVFQYAVAGTSPCVNDTAVATVFVNQQPDAGISNSVQICANAGALDLLDVLGGDPDPSGTWSNGFSGVYIPTLNDQGTFTYTVTGAAPCTNATAQVVVAEVAPPFAGNNTTVQACTDDGTIVLVNVFAPPPSSLSGTWYLQGQAVPGFFVPEDNVAGTYVYTYVVSGTGVCTADSSTVTVLLSQAPDAGGNGSATFCSTGQSAALFPFLSGTPQPGGAWFKPNGQTHTGIFQPGLDPAGQYKYRRAGSGACPADSAFVNVVVNQAPSAGGPGFLPICSDQACVPLANSLTGTPMPGGSWTLLGGGAHSEFYCPQFDASNVFVYTVAGQAPCPSATAQVQVIENLAPNAGADGFLEVCSDQPGTFPLISVLGGNPMATGTWSRAGTPFPSGVYDPGNTPDGVFTYVIAGAFPCSNDTATVTVIETTAPEAGISTAQQICSNSGPVLLFNMLGGAPNIGGTWRAPNGAPHGQTFDPANDPVGTYTYTVVGFAPCTSDSATVTISLVSAPNAGIDGALSACVNDNAVQLITGLGGSPQLNGTWSGAGQVNGVFDASAVAPGVYTFTYTVTGAGSCVPDQSVVTVTVTSALNAGATTAIELCNGTSTDLFPLLLGNPQPGGVWRDLDATGALAGSVFNATGTVPGTYDLRYVLAGSANCPGDSVDVQVTVVAGPDAGSPSTASICSNANPFELIDLLAGGPDTGGQWFGPNGLPHPDQYDPGSGAGGLFTYVVPGDANCAADSATLQILLSIAPDAGADGALTICSNDDPVALFNSLQGSPDPGGSWSFGGPHSGTYNPLTNAPGDYTYTVLGSGACPNASATVEVTEDLAPYAGAPNSISVCSSSAAFPLISQLSNGPQTGGSWIGPDLLPHGPQFDPASDAGGVYTYTVTNGSVCEPASATLTIDLTVAPYAGLDTLLSVCNTNDAVDLFAALGAGAQAGGTWQDVTGVGAALQNGVLDATVLALGNYVFNYLLPGDGPCPGDQASVTVQVGAGLDPGIGGQDTICGGDAAYVLFNSLGGAPSLGGVWSDLLGTGALLDTTDGILDATLLVPGGTYQFGYTVVDPGCGEASSLLAIVVAAFPDPGGDTLLTVCSNAPGFDLLSVLPGQPQQGGTWTDENGDPVSTFFNPAAGTGGTFLYTLQGAPPCADSSATVTIIVNQPPQAGPDVTFQACNTGELDLNSILGVGAQPDGAWSDPGGSGALTGSVADLTLLGPGTYAFTYTVTVTGCGADAAGLQLSVVDGVRIVDTTLICNEVDRNYTVRVTIEGGDPSSYAVTGISGTLTTTAPFVFTSDPIITSAPFSLTVNDANNCSPQVLDGVSPCAFDEPVFVPESFTPNGDGVNDAFIIPGIEGYPLNTIDIFNRWGVEVYSAAGYDNGAVRWDGTSADALIPGDLPTGTYFYVLELGDGSPVIKGFVHLNR